MKRVIAESGKIWLELNSGQTEAIVLSNREKNDKRQQLTKHGKNTDIIR